jgi:trk system potassium uptake protein TrkA
MKEFAVIGLGNFGASVAKKLAEFKYHVTAIDATKARVQALKDDVHLCILADATEREFLENLNIKEFDCVVVSTGEDTHASILITLYLKELGAKRIVVKAKSEDHAKILMKLGADEAIIPEKEMAIRVAHSLTRPNLIDFLPLTEHYIVAEVMTPSYFVGKTLKELKLRSKYHIQLIAAKDSSTGTFEFAPSGDYMVKQSDSLFVLGREADVEKLRG